MLNFSVKILFCRHYFNTFMRKWKDPEPEPDPDPYLWLIRIRTSDKWIRIRRPKNMWILLIGNRIPSTAPNPCLYRAVKTRHSVLVALAVSKLYLGRIGKPFKESRNRFLA
jgi:hypothetical protein